MTYIKLHILINYQSTLYKLFYSLNTYTLYNYFSNKPKHNLSTLIKYKLLKLFLNSNIKSLNYKYTSIPLPLLLISIPFSHYISPIYHKLYYNNYKYL